MTMYWIITESILSGPKATIATQISWLYGPSRRNIEREFWKLVYDLREIPENLKKLEALDNFDVFYHPGTHAKFMLTSKNWMMSTANIDGIHGLRKSFEVGILGNNKDIFSKFKEFYIELLSECPNSKQNVSELSGNSYIYKGGEVSNEFKKFPCLQCSRRFKTQSSLNQHINAKHEILAK